MVRVRLALQANIARQNVGVRGDEQNVVEGKRFLYNTHNYFVPVQSAIIRQLDI